MVTDHVIEVDHPTTSSNVVATRPMPPSVRFGSVAS
jgi:hypothetical protein